MLALLLATIIVPEVSDGDRQNCNDRVTEYYEQEYREKSDPVDEKEQCVTVEVKW